MPTRSRSLPDGGKPLLTIEQVATLLQIHTAQVSRLMHEGMPFVDVAIPRPGKHKKLAPRFDPAAVLSWLEARAQRRDS